MNSIEQFNQVILKREPIGNIKKLQKGLDESIAFSKKLESMNLFSTSKEVLHDALLLNQVTHNLCDSIINIDNSYNDFDNKEGLAMLSFISFSANVLAQYSELFEVCYLDTLNTILNKDSLISEKLYRIQSFFQNININRCKYLVQVGDFGSDLYNIKATKQPFFNYLKSTVSFVYHRSVGLSKF